jgi:hypothetical protein
MLAMFFSLMWEDPHKARSCSARTCTDVANANKHTVFVAILTFAILFDLSVVSDEGKRLGENHQKLANPAGNVKDAGLGS